MLKVAKWTAMNKLYVSYLLVKVKLHTKACLVRIAPWHVWLGGRQSWRKLAIQRSIQAELYTYDVWEENNIRQTQH